MKQLSGFWVAGVFLLMGAVLLLNPAPYVDELTAPARLPDWVTDRTPVRQPLGVPRYRAAGYTYRCSDCHRIIPSPAETVRKLVQHTEIELRHGINTRCFNCHHPVDRDSFVDDAGAPIPWAQPQLLCAKCHGPVYRDWQAGAHGRVDGYWEPSRGEQARRKCIECHDPHVPPFRSLRPAPGPNTLRMGAPFTPSHTGVRDPLKLSPLHASQPESP